MIVRKVAATRVYLNITEFYANHVVELADHIITKHYPLMTELPHTEWLGGTIVIHNKHAYHTPKVLSIEEAKRYITNCINMTELESL
ncbi:MAG: hypothetical protein J1F40_09925 [Prevotellaceae bacterium]|nr:hypothetical protein [Prevotellaceae bacterium]